MVSSPGGLLCLSGGFFLGRLIDRRLPDIDHRAAAISAEVAGE
jgi:hypothetical protein